MSKNINYYIAIVKDKFRGGDSFAIPVMVRNGKDPKHVFDEDYKNDGMGHTYELINIAPVINWWQEVLENSKNPFMPNFSEMSNFSERINKCFGNYKYVVYYIAKGPKNNHKQVDYRFFKTKSLAQYYIDKENLTDCYVASVGQTELPKNLICDKNH